MKDGGSAFPELTWERANGDTAHFTTGGMSLRDWFAGQALALLPRFRDHEEIDNAYEVRLELAKFVYDIADAMITAKEGKSE